MRIKPHFIGTEEESIPIAEVASVTIRTGLIWSDIRIDSSGGSNPIVSHGHGNASARRIRELIEGYQAGRAPDTVSRAWAAGCSRASCSAPAGVACSAAASPPCSADA